jgi:hypothetical protein
MAQADEIRALLDAGRSYPEVRKQLGCSRQAIANADAARGPRGRPRQRSSSERVTVYLTPETADWLRDEAARLGCTPGAIVDSIAARRRKRADFRHDTAPDEVKKEEPSP